MPIKTNFSSLNSITPCSVEEFHDFYIEVVDFPSGSSFPYDVVKAIDIYDNEIIVNATNPQPETFGAGIILIGSWKSINAPIYFLRVPYRAGYNITVTSGSITCDQVSNNPQYITFRVFGNTDFIQVKYSHI